MSTAVVREITLADGTVRPLGWPVVRILDAELGVEHNGFRGHQGFQNELNPETGNQDMLVSVVLHRPGVGLIPTAVWASQIDIQQVPA